MMMPKPIRLTNIGRKMMRSGRVIGSSCQRRRRLPRPRAWPVAHGRMIKVPQARACRVDELRDPRQLVELDLRHLVRVRVVVGMQAVVEEDDGNASIRV